MLWAKLNILRSGALQSKGRWFLPHSGINLPSWKTHIWSAMEKKLQGLIQRYRSNIVKLRFWMQAGNLWFPEHATSTFTPHKHPFKVLGKILKTDSGTHGSSVMRSQTSLDLTIQRMRNWPTLALRSHFLLHRRRACVPMPRPAARRQRLSWKLWQSSALQVTLGKSIWIETVQLDCWKQQRKQLRRPAFG